MTAFKLWWLSSSAIFAGFAGLYMTAPQSVWPLLFNHKHTADNSLFLRLSGTLFFAVSALHCVIAGSQSAAFRTKVNRSALAGCLVVTGFLVYEHLFVKLYSSMWSLGILAAQAFSSVLLLCGCFGSGSTSPATKGRYSAFFKWSWLIGSTFLTLFGLLYIVAPAEAWSLMFVLPRTPETMLFLRLAGSLFIYLAAISCVISNNTDPAFQLKVNRSGFISSIVVTGFLVYERLFVDRYQIAWWSCIFGVMVFISVLFAAGSFSSSSNANKKKL
eukprot:GILI01004986.1.p1 GENE.GILI01004986.1~~GILI01004986.1.p1  ORF type:complete len:290 (-),score=76.58 GILI01004986.1:179-997(-)